MAFCGICVLGSRWVCDFVDLRLCHFVEAALKGNQTKRATPTRPHGRLQAFDGLKRIGHEG